MYSLLRRLEAHANDQRQPLNVTIELTHRCNHQCPFCYVDHLETLRQELTLEQWKPILLNLREAGCVSALVTGGEVFLHEDCLNVLRELKRLGLLTTLFTNGSKITRERARVLGELKLGEIGITLYGADEETHDRYAKSRGSFRKVMDALRWLGEEGCRVQLKWNAVPETVYQTGQFIDVAEGLGLEWQANGVVTKGRTARCQPRTSNEELEFFYATLITRDQTIEQSVGEAKNMAANWLRERVLADPICSAGRTSARIDPTGAVYPCIDIVEPIGNLTEEPFGELWRSDRWDKFLEFKLGDFPHCSSCAYYNVCKYQCPGSFKSESGSYHGLNWDHCRNTQAYLRAMDRYLTEAVGEENNPIHIFLEAINAQSDSREKGERHREGAPR